MPQNLVFVPEMAANPQSRKIAETDFGCISAKFFYEALRTLTQLGTVRSARQRYQIAA
jgi:hypothetical protein